jgi:hypothetical protein
MENKSCVVVLDEGVEEEIVELANCCKPGAPSMYKPPKKKCKTGGPAPHRNA